MKYLLVLAVLALAIMLWLRRQRRQNTPSTPPAQALPAAENMARCAHCGIHVPQSQAVRHNGRCYCCTAHRDLNLSQ